MVYVHIQQGFKTHIPKNVPITPHVKLYFKNAGLWDEMYEEMYAGGCMGWGVWDAMPKIEGHLCEGGTKWVWMCSIVTWHVLCTDPVRATQLQELSDLSCLRVTEWDQVGSVEWDKLNEMRRGRWVKWGEMSWVTWVLWDELGELSCVRWVEWLGLC